MTNEDRIYPDVAIAPGETLAETLEALGMTQAELARRAGRPAQAISEMIQGKKEITAETALEFERVLGVPQHVWLALESDYRSVKARIAEAERLRSESPLAEAFPYAAMVKLGWVNVAREAVDRVRELCRFFGVASLRQVALPNVAWRKSNTVKHSQHALAAWLRKGELDAQKIATKPFDGQKLRDSLPVLRGLTREPTFAGRLQKILAECGVAVAFVPGLPKTGAHGATRWIGSRPMIQLSIRYRWSDIFWFTVFHELGHILLHGKETFIEFNADGDDAREEEADRFAGSQLIPQSLYSAFVAAASTFSSSRVMEFADQIGVAAGIVVGRLQHDRRIAHSYLNELRTQLAWAT